jgi:hypothetical protein
VSFAALPSSAAWQHRQARTGFEVAYLETLYDSYRVTGTTAASDAGSTWIVEYVIDLDSRWRTRRAAITGKSFLRTNRTVFDTDGAGHWRIDGTPAAHLDGCLDIDLESSALTNTFPVHRLALDPGEHAQAPAAYVRALPLTVERLEQGYSRVSDGTRGQRYDYTAPVFDFGCLLTYDAAGLVLEYPGIAIRAV